MRLHDKHGRSITDLARVSITDRCNYKCVYCRTGNEGARVTLELPFADYLRLVRIFAATRALRRCRLTGGEPLLRNGIADFSASWPYPADA